MSPMNDMQTRQEPSAALLLAILQRDTLPALTMTEPWCSLMAEQQKWIETRTWRTTYRGPVALHAASTLPKDLNALCHQEHFYEALALRHFCGGRWSFPRKYVLAIGMLEESIPTEAIKVTAREHSFGNYQPGRYAWRFSAIYRLKTPLRASGSLSLWNWTPPKQFWDEIQAQYDAVLAKDGKDAIWQ